MAYFGHSNAAFQSGINYLANPGKGNENSITLSGGLEATGDRWTAESQDAATTPHSVLSMYNFSRSANGSDGDHYIPGVGFTGSANGTSADDYQENLMLRMAGNGTNNIP
jgi:hypothetical protein